MLQFLLSEERRRRKDSELSESRPAQVGSIQHLILEAPSLTDADAQTQNEAASPRHIEAPWRIRIEYYIDPQKSVTPIFFNLCSHVSPKEDRAKFIRGVVVIRSSEHARRPQGPVTNTEMLHRDSKDGLLDIVEKKKKVCVTALRRGF